MFVKIEHQIVSYDRIAGGKEGHEAIDKVLLRRRHAFPQVGQVRRKIDFLDSPSVLDGSFILFVEDRVLHRS